jgi:hypothetical protein
MHVQITECGGCIRRTNLKMRAISPARTGSAYCGRAGFPKVMSGLRKPIAIQAAISFNMNLPE